MAACGGDLGSVLRLLACHRANYQPDDRRHTEPHAAFLSCRGTCRGYGGVDLANARAEQRRDSTDDAGKKLTLDRGKAGRRLFGRFAIGGDHYLRALSPNNSQATRIISIWS